MDAKVRPSLNDFNRLGTITALAISRDEEILYVGSKDGECFYIYLDDIGEIDDFSEKKDPQSVLITPDNQFLIYGGEKIITMWDLIKKKIHLRLYTSHSGT